jgi:ferredoxin
MLYFQVNEKCNGCLACVQNCPARALDVREVEGKQTLLHNMARCARCATCWRVCPQQAIEFQYMLQNSWDEVVTHTLVRCKVCGKVVHTEQLSESLDMKVRDFVEPLCHHHKLEKQAGVLTGRVRQEGGTAQ